MFYYLSFLRPPPSQTQPSGTISITPQIANDLRTGHFNCEQDIFYSWRRIPTTPGENPAQTKAKKLTTWRQATAYKSIPVPVPVGVRDGEVWRLVLSCSPVRTISLGDSHLGHLPFPVLSMPIEFSSRMNKGAVPKQDKIERVYAFSLPRPYGLSSTTPSSTLVVDGGGDTPANVAIRITEQTSFDLDKKIWDSGIGLSSWLVNLARAPSEPDLDAPAVSLDESLKLKSQLVGKLRDTLFADQPRCVVELGAGTGIVALTIGALRGVLAPEGETLQSCIITTDRDSAMPLLEHNIDSNARLFPEGTGARPVAMILNWDNEEIPKYIQNIARQRGGLDAIVMADVTYNTSSFPSLVRTLCSLVRLSRKPPFILLGYKERDAAERSLWSLAQEANIRFTLVGNIPGAGSSPIEIWISIFNESG